jgi:hypothetical protein
VWWDRDIPPGKTFDEVIEEALASAKCVIVLWSRESVQSEWVKAEASEAAKRRVLVPILADEVKIPLEFRRIQSARLIDWTDLPANADWDQLERALATLVGQRAKTQPPRAPIIPPTKAATKLRPLTIAAAVLIPVVAIAGYLAISRSPREELKPRVVAAVPVPANAAATQAPATPVPPPAQLGRLKPAPPVPQDLAPRSLEMQRDGPALAGPTATEVPAVVATTARVSPVRTTSDDSFEVTHTRGVFRNQTGRLTVSSDGVRYKDSGDGGGTGFEAACIDIRTVATPNVIVDREQRMVEIGLRGDRSYRFIAADTSARDGIVSALSRSCGPR